MKRIFLGLALWFVAAGIGIGQTGPVNTPSRNQINNATISGTATIGGTTQIGVASANYLQLAGGSTGNVASVFATGSDTDVGLALIAKNAGSVVIRTNGSSGSIDQVRVTHTASANRYVTLTGANSGNPAIGVSGGGLLVSSTLFASALTTAAGTPNSICQNDATKEITVNAALTCTVSSSRYKENIRHLDVDALRLVMALKPAAFAYKDRPARDRAGFIAEDVSAVDKRLAEFDDKGRPNSIDLPALVSLLTKAVQEQQAQIGELRKVIAAMEQGSNRVASAGR